MNRIRDDRFALKLWIWLSAAACVAGWLLSAVRWLDFAGYAFSAILAGAVGIFARWRCHRRAAEGCRTPGRWRVLRSASTIRKVLKCGGSPPLFVRGCRRALPLLFLLLAVLVFISGILYPPTNHMGLTYRLPRVLHWLADHGWSWVHAPDPRINDRACDNEWMMAPVLLFTHSDRALFILNFIPFLLLPGLVFSTW